MTPDKPKRSVVGVAGLVGVATLLSKFVGLLREIVVAAAFGVSGQVDAFSIAYKIPSFLLILLGGVNGPFYSAVISVVSQQERSTTARLMETINTLVTLLLGVVGLGLWFGAPYLVPLVAQGADPSVQALAVMMLQLMAPVAVLAGLIGLGFGVLTAADRYLLPSLSPILSSGASILAVLLFAHPFGPVVLAWGVLAGALLQWLAQLPWQWQLGLGSLRPRWEWRRPEVQQVLRLMGPATVSSALSNVNVYTDVFFASQLVTGVIGGLDYANRLLQTPIGILSNVLLIPAFPIFSRLAGLQDREELRLRVRQAVLTVFIAVLPLTALGLALAEPLVSVVFERGAFDQADVQLVAQIYVGYSFGMVSYLLRDLLIRVFYALGDAQLPLRVSLLGIGTNLFLDWLLIQFFGPMGLSLASSGVSLIACVVLIGVLRRRLGGLGWRGLERTALILLVGALPVWAATVLTYDFLKAVWPLTGTLPVLIKLAIAGSVGLGVEALWLWTWRIAEVQTLVEPILRRLKK